MITLDKIVRRHSITNGQTANQAIQEEGRTSRSQSKVTKSMSAGINLLQRKLSRDNFNLGQFGVCVDKEMVEKALVKYYNDESIKVIKLINKSFSRNRTETFLEIRTTGILQEYGRKKLDVILKSVDVEEKDKEYEVHRTLLMDVKTFLNEMEIPNIELMVIQKQIEVPAINDNMQEENKLLFLVEDLKCSGFKGVLLKNLDGFDYEHSVLVIAALARFHAASYSFRKLQKIKLELKYPFLSEDISAPKVSKDKLKKLEDIFKQQAEYGKYSWMFKTVMNGEVEKLNKNLTTFGVFSHGNFIKQNMVFKYKRSIDSKLSCSEVIFKDLSSCYYGSCVLDLLQFIFTSIDHQVRHSFMPDFVCSVYYDSFVKTVININEKIPVFSKKSFIKEFDRNIMYGFLFSLDFFDHFKEPSEKISEEDIESSEKMNIEQILRDVIQFKLNTRETLKVDAKYLV